MASREYSGSGTIFNTFYSISFQTILLGDSGVGKTSFLVKFNTGEFRAGSFSATVGIALTVSQNPFKSNCFW